MNRQLLISAALLLALAAVGWMFWSRYAAEPDAEPAVESAPSTPREVPTTTPDGPEPDPLPPLDLSDPLAADALRAAGGGQGALAAALAETSLVRRFVGAVNAVAQGRSPVAHIRFLQPEQQFRAEGRDGGLVIDPASFVRYDPLAAAISRLDADRLLAEYGRMEPLFQSAHAELGVEGRFRTVLMQALDLLLATPVPQLPIEVEDHVEYYAYVDSRLADLSEAQKHLLRLGPENQRRVMAKLTQLREGLGRLD